MSNPFFFSINLLIKSDSHLEKSIASIVADKRFFSEHVQLILIDSVGSKLSVEICSRYSNLFPKNVVFMDAKNKREAECYNETRPLCTGTYLLFTDNYGEYSEDTFSSVYKISKSGKIPVLCIAPLLSLPGENTRPYVSDIQKGLVKLRDYPDRFILMLGCHFFNRRVIDNIVFDEQLDFHSDAKFITEALLKTYSYIFLDNCTYTTSNACETQPFRYEPQYSKLFYTRTINEFMLPMLVNYAGIELVEAVMMYLLEVKFSLNADNKYKNVIIGDFVTEFIDTAAEALKFIDDHIILSKRLCRVSGLDPETPFRLLRLKEGKNLFPDITMAGRDESVDFIFRDISGRMMKTALKGEFAATVDHAVVTRSGEMRVEVLAINHDSEGLYIDAQLWGGACLKEKDFQIFAVVNKKKYRVLKSNVYTLRKLFDIPFLKKYTFRMFIPVSSGKEMDTAVLLMNFNGLTVKLNWGFHHTFSRISNQYKHSYWCFNDRMMTYDAVNKALVIRRCTDSLAAKYEAKFLSEISRDLSLTETMYYRQLRKSVHRTMSDKQRNKSILFYEDTGINHNGDLLFRYFSKFKRNDAIDVYFTAPRGSNAEAFLIDSGYNNVIETGSKKSKLTTMTSSIIVATDCDVYESLGFSKRDRLILRDLLNAKIVSVKNFFLTTDTAQFDNRLRDNTQMVYCASKQEKEQILHEVYDYDESMIKLTGYPMLDSINDNRKKIILISPVDRHLFNIYENSNFYHFSDSRFFKVYTELLSDRELLTAVQSAGYTIALMLPKTIEKYSKMFATDDCIKIYENNETNEINLVNDAALLITDYSELQYRFAYMNKPVLYYHPSGLPVDREYKRLRLSSTGFGDVVFDEKNLKDYIVRRIKKNFPQSPRYETRIQEFFEHLDSDNCGRVMTSILDTFFSER